MPGLLRCAVLGQRTPPALRSETRRLTASSQAPVAHTAGFSVS